MVCGRPEQASDCWRIRRASTRTTRSGGPIASCIGLSVVRAIAVSVPLVTGLAAGARGESDWIVLDPESAPSSAAITTRSVEFVDGFYLEIDAVFWHLSEDGGDGGFNCFAHIGPFGQALETSQFHHSILFPSMRRRVDRRGNLAFRLAPQDSPGADTNSRCPGMKLQMPVMQRNLRGN